MKLVLMRLSAVVSSLPLLVMLLAPIGGPALAQDARNIAELALSDKPDRMQRLIEGANREGSVNLYTSMNASTASKVKADFEKRYPGVKVNLWRAGSEAVLQRSVTETRARRHTFDVLETNGSEMEAAQREKLLQPAASAHFRDLVPQAVMPHREWVATRLNLFVHCFNTRQVKREELPKSFDDLLHPRWKGRLGVEATDHDWFMSVVTGMGEEKGLKLFRDIVAKNGMTVRKGHALLVELVTAGEVPMGLTCYSYKVDQDRKAGAPLEWISLGPIIARPNGIGISRNAPHPHAALLFYEYMISDVQPLLSELEFVPVSAKIESPLKGREVRFIDPKRALDEQERWEKLFKEVFVTKTQ